MNVAGRRRNNKGSALPRANAFLLGEWNSFNHGYNFLIFYFFKKTRANNNNKNRHIVRWLKTVQSSSSAEENSPTGGEGGSCFAFERHGVGIGDGVNVLFSPINSSAVKGSL